MKPSRLCPRFLFILSSLANLCRPFCKGMFEGSSFFLGRLYVLFLQGLVTETSNVGRLNGPNKRGIENVLFKSLI